MKSLAFLIAALFSLNAEALPFDAIEEVLFQPNNITDAGLTGTKVLALTFDDGPTNPATPAVLDVLRRHGVPAVFFINGKNVPGKEHLLNRVFQEGHLLANHTHTHKNLHHRDFNSPANLIAAIARTHELIRGYVRPSEMFLFRAPFGAWKSQHATVLNANQELRQYVGPIFWNVGGELKNGHAADWACWDQGVSVSRCRDGYIKESLARKGGVVLFHDKDSRTAQMLDGYISAMKANGYRFIRLDNAAKLQRYR